MSIHYLLSATGADRPGIVAAVAEVLFRQHGNMEESSMMRLGSEFGILAIFTTKKPLSTEDIQTMASQLEKQFSLLLSVKRISSSQARFAAIKGQWVSISVHGPDQPGIVRTVTRVLARHHFNVTDLSTHRTTGKTPGFILFLEGELRRGKIPNLRRSLHRLEKQIRVRVSVNEIVPRPL